jgi:mono/diheme cytochrome c family protein
VHTPAVAWGRKYDHDHNEENRMLASRIKDTAALALVLAVPLAAALFYSGPGGQAYAASAGTGPDGKAVFLAQKCNLCHAVGAAGIEATTKSEKMKGPDLTGAVAERGAEWTAKFLKKEVDRDGKKHGKAFTGSDEELAALVAWLAEQKKK